MPKTVVLGVTSGIAAYKTLDLIKLLKEEGLGVFVIMTKSATKMISVKEFEKASDNKVYVELFEKDFDYKKILSERQVEHIALADKADVIAIVPATANFIAKIAYGLADDFLSTTLLAATSPVVICPAMNVNMWNNPVVIENVKKLKNLGFQIVEPTSGMLACGYEGKGRLEEVQLIKNEIMKQINRVNLLKGQKIIVTSGGTKEKIDEVRYITNRSSGKMGVAIAEECFLEGADVLLLRSEDSIRPRYLINEETFTTADELFELVKKYIKNYDLIYHVAAVSDFKLEKIQKGKVSSDKGIKLSLKPQIKISDQIKKLNTKIKLVVFKAEYGLDENQLIKQALQKLMDSKADVVAANDVSKNDRGFDADRNEVFVVFKNRENKKVFLNSKTNVAKELVKLVNEKG